MQGRAEDICERIIHGRVYRMVAEPQAAVDAFADFHNERWLPEENGFLSPVAMRAEWHAREVAA